VQRARRPLDPKALAAADAAVRDLTDPRGRRLDPASPADAPLRARWLQAYAAAGGTVEKAASSPDVGSPAVACDHYIELRYLHCNHAPVKGAKYHVRSPAFSADGTLDEDGFVRIGGVPPIGGFTFWFDADPAPYVPRGPSVQTSSAAVKEPAVSYFDTVVDWIWGTIQGDFNKNASISQIAVNTVLGVVPVVDQVLDVRDLIAGIKALVEYYAEDASQQQSHEDVLGLSYEAWLWLALFLIALGAIPEVGSVVKGVLKGLIRFLQDAMKRAGDLSPAQLRRVWEELVEILNHLGVKPGNAHAWLKALPGRLDGWMDQAAVTIKGGLDAFGAALERLESAAQRFGIGPSLERIRRMKAALRKAYDRLDAMKRRINTWLKQQLERVLGGKHHFETDGTIDTHAGKEGPNVRTQNETPPPEPTIPPKPMRTRPTGARGSKPTGTRSDAANKSLPGEMQRSFKRENEAADLLADAGYRVEQNPPGLPNGKNPDYSIEGQTFDALSPTSGNVDQVRKGISKKVKEEQASRIVLNLNDTSVGPDDVRAILGRKPIEGLQEVIGIQGTSIVHIFP